MSAKTAARIVSLMGLWLLTVPFLAFDFQVLFWNNLLAGILMTITGFAMIGPFNWQAWTAGTLGLWLILSALIPFFLFGPGLWWNDMITGSLSVTAGLTALIQHSRRKL